ncbi:MAG: glycoside hydrolase family 9 protein [Tannerellaceae bacterium]|jgi:hypothetical protein|nr:glycoside hydrolase family 9 protein [Tannerellaceae bacterium]
MKRTIPIIILLVACQLTNAQIDEQLKRDIRLTGYVHSPLPLDHSKSFETFGIAKKAIKSDLLCDMESLSQWTHKGIGELQITDQRSITGKHSLRITSPTHVDQFLGWGLGFGTSLADFAVGGKNWEGYNRIKFYIYPDCEGARSIYLNLYIENEGKIKVPDQYGREGYHEINLVNGKWNECFVEMSELPRDKVTKLSFAIEMFGREETMGQTLQFDIDRVELQTIENPEVVSGWQPAGNRIIFSTSGYRTESSKTAITTAKDHKGKFQLIDNSNSQTVFEGDIVPLKSPIGNFQTLNFSSFKKQGVYRIKAGSVTSEPFYINPDLWENSAWRVLNFMFCERCGYPVPGKHASCHTDLNGEYNGHKFTINGGWHDAADMSQQTLQTGEISFSFLEMAKRAKEKGNLDLYNRLMEEALWGIDFILKARLGDGYRMQTWGTNLWTDGLIGTIDDSGRRQVRIHNGGFENFGYAAIEAFASMMIENDPEMKLHLRKVAEEDYAFAMKRFDDMGYNERIAGGGGHAYMASQSQYMAHLSFASSLLYRLTANPYYAQKAAEAIRYTLNCQRTEPIGSGKISGFFYRDTNRKSIVHYNHQSRDQVYIQALAALCETQPEHPQYGQWRKSIDLYASYLKSIMKYVQPYGMMPSGIYHIDEVKDSVNFYVQHVRVDKGAEADYAEQLRNGIRIDDKHYLRFFPVWFSFKGNAAVHLATGKAAAICGKLLNDPELLDIAEQQLFWIVGKNPFGQSLIYGEGSNYAQQYCALPGETVGEIPVGMQSRFNEDTPYWPQFNTATYKEVWGSSAGKWMSLIAEF